MFSNYYLVCSFIEPKEVGYQFTRPEWPLHATVIPWFNLRTDQTELVAILQRELLDFQPFMARVKAQDNTRYIPNRGVSLLDTESWQLLQKSLFGPIALHAGTFITRVFNGISYRPHVT